MSTKGSAGYIAVEVVEVRAWGRRVGAVALDPKLGAYSFEYDPKFAATGVELAPLTMPLRDADRPYVFPSLPEPTYQRLPAMLADALPDSFGNALIDAWMANKGLKREMVTTLDRLAYMGKRSMGALEFRPSRGPNTSSSTAIALGKLVNEARSVLRGEIDTDDHAQAALKQIIQVGTSAGGARAKATVAWNPDTNEVRAGQLTIPNGFAAWLLKFDGVGKDMGLGASRDYGRIEYAYSMMATAAGITMAPCHLLQENGRAHFMTQRFDRDGNRRHHMQTLCAMRHLDYKQRATHSYNQLFDTVQQLELGRGAMIEVLRRMVFNVVARNCDDHSKNHSFLLREGGQWELSPAYDITYAFDPANEWVHQHLMSVNGKFANITRDDLRAVADRYELLSEVNAAIERANEATSRWSEFAQAAGVAPEEIERILQELSVQSI
ncbi:MAG: type II toxin-antitoxin system HipA family toxin [Burkholderiales bacterium]